MVQIKERIELPDRIIPFAYAADSKRLYGKIKLPNGIGAIVIFAAFVKNGKAITKAKWTS